MRMRDGLIAVLVAVSVTSTAHANTVAAPALVADWTEFAVQAKPGKCASLPAQFALASIRQGQVKALQYVADNNRWTWQLGSKSQTLAASFWASDLDAGVSYRDPLEVSRAPSPALLQGLLAGNHGKIGLGCGGTATVVKRWRAPLFQPTDSHLLDQSDLADMEGNALATALSHRIGAEHHH